jgi:hypothetical protein
MMIKEIYGSVKALLEQNKEYSVNQVFLQMAKMHGYYDGSAICNAMWDGSLPFSYESISRAIRKVREENEHLRDKGYKKRTQAIEKQVRQEVRELTAEEKESEEFHTQKIQQGALL